MGGNCCAARKIDDRKSVLAQGAYETRKKAISIRYHSKGGDAAIFDMAVESNDLHALVRLLASEQKIDSFEERMHPWAEDPKTVGALAGTQLAILASTADASALRNEIRKAGAIPPLVEFLKSSQEDRVQAAVVGLSFLTAECPENAQEAFNNGIMPLLFTCMDSTVAGKRAAAATTLRNICIDSEDRRKVCVEGGGMIGLVNQLNAVPDPALNHSDVQLEAILNLQDMVEADDGTLMVEFAQEAVNAGAVAALKRLCHADDEEVRSAAADVLSSFAKLSNGGAVSLGLNKV